MARSFSSPRLAILVSFFLTVLLFSLGCLLSYQKMRVERQADTHAEAESMVLAFEAHSTRLFDYADSYLRAIRAFRAEFGDGEKWESFVRDVKAPHAELFSGVVTLVDRDGRLVHQSGISRETLAASDTQSDLEQIQYFREHPGDALHVSATRLDRLTGKPQFQLARPLFRDGAFDGLVMLSLRPEYITDFHRKASLGPHTSVTMLTREQKLIARQPPAPQEMLGRLLPDFRTQHGMQIAAGAGGRALGIVSPFDHLRRDVFYKTLVDYPVTLMVGVAEEDIDAGLAGARRNMSLLALAFSAIALVVSALILRMSDKQRELLQAREFNLAVLNSVSAEIAVLDRHGVILTVNEPWRRFALANGPAPGEPAAHCGIGANFLAFDAAGSEVASRPAFETLEGIQAVLDGRAPALSVEFPLATGGQQRWFSLRVSPLGSAAHDGVVLTRVDITQIKQAEEDLRIAAAAFESQEAMLVTDARSVILRVNRAFTAITGYSAEEAVGQTPRLLRSGRHNDDFYRTMWATLQRNGSWQGEIWDRRKNGEEYPKWLTISAVKDETGVATHYISVQYDISERKEAEEKIRALAFSDSLTGLANRTLLFDRLRQAMATCARRGSFGALLYLDLDKFKHLNDTLGHAMGDLLLQQVGQRLAGCVRSEDTVARLGGDEFVLMLKELGARADDAATQAEAIGEKILAILAPTYRLEGQAYPITASIGITLFGHPNESPEELLRQADLAMYQAKAAGRNALRFFDPAMQTAVETYAALERDLRSALRERQFILHYQPQVDVSGRCTGAEALVRWQHPGRGLVFPDAFIPLAEETGLILQLGQWVLETACEQLAAWAARPQTARLTLAVNVSARQLRQKDFVAQVLALLARTGADPSLLKLELTESHLLNEVEESIAKMNELKARGVGFELDDFGTGYSSLSYLKRLPLEKLKIDRSFVMDVLTDANDAAIARTIVALGRSLGLAVLAEGVETEAQRAFLADNGCTWYQGYLFSRPVPLAAFEAYLSPVA